MYIYISKCYVCENDVSIFYQIIMRPSEGIAATMVQGAFNVGKLVPLDGKRSMSQRKGGTESVDNNWAEDEKLNPNRFG